MSLKMIGVLQSLSDQSVVIDLPIDRKGNGLLLVSEGLRSTVDSDNTQSLVCQNCEVLANIYYHSMVSQMLTCVVCNITSRPIWATVTALLHHLQSSRFESLCVWDMVASHDSTHFAFRVRICPARFRRFVLYIFWLQ
jgi:hypothetical protein